MATSAPALLAGRPWGRALRWLAFLAPFFFLSYGAANYLAARRAEVGAIVFDWEHLIPFRAWTIIPYWTIDAFYGLSLFVARDARELDIHARRLLTAQIGAVACFILFPLRFTFARPETDGVSRLLIDLLMSFDQPFNQAPSLHIALLVVLWVLYARHVPGWARWPLHAWFALIGVSVLTTFQHHFIDIPTGALLGFLCLWLWPDDGPSPLAAAARAHDARRLFLAKLYALGAALCAAAAFELGGAVLWLLWPAVSLLLVAANYALLGVAGFQKGADGRMSLAARALLAPYLAGAWINSRLWTRRDPAAVAIADGVSLGRLPARGPADGAVVDVAAELPGGSAPAWHAVPMLDLVVPDAAALRAAADAIERARSRGPVLVCCALGFSRSVAAVATWLVATRRAASVDAALARIAALRPRLVVSAELRAAIAAAASP